MSKIRWTIFCWLTWKPVWKCRNYSHRWHNRLCICICICWQPLNSKLGRSRGTLCLKHTFYWPNTFVNRLNFMSQSHVMHWNYRLQMLQYQIKWLLTWIEGDQWFLWNAAWEYKDAPFVPECTMCPVLEGVAQVGAGNLLGNVEHFTVDAALVFPQNYIYSI